MNPIEGLIVARYVNLRANTGYPQTLERIGRQTAANTVRRFRLPEVK